MEKASNNLIEAPGVLEEFDLAVRLGKFVIPFGASGWAAMAIWKKVMSEPEAYYGAVDVAAPLKVLGDAGRKDDEYIGAIFQMLDRLSS